MKLTKTQAFRHVLRLILDAPIPGMWDELRKRLERTHAKDGPYTFDDYGLIKSIEWEWAFGVSATLRVGETLCLPINHKATAKDVEVHVSWSSGGGDPARAISSCIIHRQVAELACHIQMFFADTTFIEDSEEKEEAEDAG
jgi:hypothetical protein